ncbi:MAG: GatB/YqeY domain-containing protein [Desulfovibrio sp.]|nr:GatB/YqeY domain-containing protein [Desulfovibrio sp.]MCA1987406.1 GatB/YqeY domain-containing protein [Desulfovibrio sp.]
MSLIQRIEQEYLAAYKAKQETVLLTLRAVKTACKLKQVELRRPLEDADVLGVLQKEAKQRQESIDQFTAAGRDDLAAKEAAELAVLRMFLPEAMPEEALRAVVDETVTHLGAASIQDMGKVMQAIMAEHKGKVDGKALSALVKARLQH